MLHHYNYNNNNYCIQYFSIVKINAFYFCFVFLSRLVIVDGLKPAPHPTDPSGAIVPISISMR